MIVDAVCGSVAYWNHLGPVWVALDPSERGVLYAPHEAVHAHISVESVLGLPVNSRLHPDPYADRLTLVASWQDSERVKWRPVVLIEHGVGQRYPRSGKDGYDGHPSNPGGRERENVVLFLCPNSHVAQDNFMVYPDAEYAVVGPTNLDALIQERWVAVERTCDIEFWHEYMRYSRVHPSQASPRVVHDALRQMATEWRPRGGIVAGDDSQPEILAVRYRELLGELLALAGTSYPEWLRDTFAEGPDVTSASSQLGTTLWSYPHGPDDRSRLSQSRPNLSWGRVPTSKVSESGASGASHTGRERAELPTDTEWDELQKDFLHTRPSPKRRESSRCSEQEGTSADLSYLPQNASAGLQRTEGGKPVTCVSWHWNNAQSPLSRWAFYDYQDVIPTLTDHFTVIGHSHPRVAKFMSRYFESHDIEYVTSLYEVASRASVYVVDSSSSGYEMAALGIPTVWLNSRRWPRHLTAWPRFWDCVPGPQVDTPEDLLPTIKLALMDPEPWPTIRRRVVEEVYSGGLDGKASHRAVEAIRSLDACRLDSLRSGT